MEPFLTYQTAAVVMGCSPGKVKKMCLNGEIPIIKVGNETRIDPADLRAWRDQNKHFHVPKSVSEKILLGDSKQLQVDTSVGSVHANR